MTFWKDNYKDKLQDGVDRVNSIVKRIESWGLTCEDFGFLPRSAQYVTQNPEEKGEPDLRIKNSNILIECTGSRYVKNHDIWIRPDKFSYAESHPEFECYLAHYIDSELLLRFIKLHNQIQFPIIKPTIRGNVETYRNILADNPMIIMSNEFRDILKEKLK